MFQWSMIKKRRNEYLNSLSTSKKQLYYSEGQLSQKMQHVDPHKKLHGVIALSEQFSEIFPFIGKNGGMPCILGHNVNVLVLRWLPFFFLLDSHVRENVLFTLEQLSSKILKENRHEA